MYSHLGHFQNILFTKFIMGIIRSYKSSLIKESFFHSIILVII